MPFQAGEQVGSYRILEQLGRGGMATVFKAYHANLDRYVAIKVLHPAFMEDETFLARFEREAKVVARLEHPHIIPIYDYSEHEGHPYLVMKYVEGETLKARLKKRPLTPEEGSEIIQAVGDGLAYAHKQDILHRDIKPSNVMIGTDGHIYLTDFGLARIASAGESTLSSDMMLGTPQYISPEQAMGKRNLDAGTDIYSFGVLIYELMVGQVPFSADTPFSIVHDHIYTPLPLPRTVNPNVPEVIERLLLKGLAKVRADRFESVGEMVDAFRQAIRGEDMEQVWVDPGSYTPTQTPQPMPIGARAQIDPSQTLPPSGSGSAPAAAKKRAWRWWYSIPLGMLLCVCLLLVIGALSDNPEEPFIPFDTNSPASQVEDALPNPAALAEAEANAADHPDDPYVYLDLAGALIDVGNQDDAKEAFDTGAALAKEDGNYFFTAGDMLASRELWVEALEQYTAALSLSPEYVTSETAPKLQKAMYYAAEDENAKQLLLGVRLDSIPPELGLDSFFAAQARYNLLVLGKPEIGLELVREALSETPGSPMARLVRAEILIMDERTDEAVESLQGLMDDAAPSWVQNQARILLSTVQ
ncbi:MAG TPA: serine/threonine-protein kinase [Anaerolineales bacterium]|nr:serine/threonine-protein kinase [Anaerolineales bacterium]